MEQRSKEWFEIRRGKATASKFGVLMAVRGLGKAADDYALEIAGHDKINIFEEQIQTQAMREGMELEPYAISYYELENICKVNPVGFVSHPTIKTLGGSPDGLVGEDGGVEVKCPKQTKHLSNLVSEKCPAEYLDQIQGCMFITGRKWWDFVSYNPNFKEGSQLKIIRVYPDLEWQEKFKTRVSEFEKLVSNYSIKLNQVN